MVWCIVIITVGGICFCLTELKQKLKPGKTRKKQQKPSTPQVQMQKTTSQSQPTSVPSTVQVPQPPATVLKVTDPCVPCQNNLDAAQEHISDMAHHKVRNYQHN